MAVNFLSLAYLEEPSLRNGETPKEVEDLLPFLVIEGSCGSWRTIDETPDTQTSLVSRIYYWILILSAERLGPAGTRKLLEAVIVNRIPLVTLHPRRNPFDRTRNPANDHRTMCPAGSAAPSFARIDKNDRSGISIWRLIRTEARTVLISIVLIFQMNKKGTERKNVTSFRKCPKCKI